ncbi:MAG: hypothetical protein FD129_1421 [bacterium]|nr:MAG: hypothetical protein FD129_1421 [bacterium]
MTASTPSSVPSSRRTTGTPPPPSAITMKPASRNVRMACSSTISIGIGEGTTRRQPRPESSRISHPFVD